MKLLLVAGGGGHFAPALALIESLPKDWEVHIIGRKYAFEADKTISLEYQTAKKLGIPFSTITTGRLQRKLTKHTLQSIAKIPVGFRQAMQILKEYQPDVLVSFGGYVSVPVAIAAKLQHVPIIVHEQTMGAGLANKFVGNIADKIALSWKQSESVFPKGKTVLTGNPLQKEFIETIQLSSRPTERSGGISFLISSSVAKKDPSTSLRSAQDDKKTPLLYITGGSGGSHAINVLIESCLEQLLHKYRIVHQTGDAKQFGDFARLEAKKKTLPPELRDRYLVTKFVDSADVFDLLRKADLVIARSGIGTVTQLLAMGKPCIFIPLPYGQKNEQLTNAMFVKKIGIGEIAQEYGLTGDALYALIEKMFQHYADYTKHSSEAKAVIDLQATQKLISLISHVTSKNKKEITQS